MNYDEYTTRDLKLELETVRVANSSSVRLEIENEILKRERAFLESEIKRSEPDSIGRKIARVLKYGFVTIVILIGLLVYFGDVSLKAKGGGSTENRIEADRLAKEIVYSISDNNFEDTIKLFNPKFTDINHHDYIKNIDAFRATYPGSPKIVGFELENKKLLAGSKNPDYIYLYNMIVNYSSKSVAIRVVIGLKENQAFVTDFRVIKDMPLKAPSSA